MEITYRLAGGPNAIGWEHRHNCATAPGADLLWSFFPGDVGIKEGEDGFETNFGWVPILHFSLSMIAIYESLSKVGDVIERYIFTEADESLSFRRSGTAVVIEPSFSPTRIISHMAAMRVAVKSFTERVISDLGSAYPSLLENTLIDEMFTKANNL
jgi:hypothetical protein